MTPACTVNNAIKPMKKPAKLLPTSPMKIRAGCQFQTRNPAAEAQATVNSTDPPLCIPVMAVTSEKPVTNNSSAPARPSIPSMKLNRLVSQTRATRARTNRTDWLRIVKKPKSSAGTSPSQNSDQSAAPKCRGIRHMACTFFRSSIRPTMATA